MTIASNSIIPQPLSVVNFANAEQASSATLAIGKPSGTLDGDFMLAMTTADTTVSWTGDTGWNELLDSGGLRLRVAGKVAQAEGASYTFTANTSANLSGAIVSVRYAEFDAIGAASASSANPVAPQITLSKNNGLLIAFYSCDTASVSFSAPGGMTGLASDSDATAPSWAVCFEGRVSGATGTRTSVSSPGTNSAGVLIGLKPFYP